jgi:hypothetical protein
MRKTVVGMVEDVKESDALPLKTLKIIGNPG